MSLAAALLASAAFAEGAPEPPRKPTPAPARPLKPAKPPAPPSPKPEAEAAPVAPLVVRPPASITVNVPASAAEWRLPDAENTLVLDTDRGRVVIELRPEFAPLAVARIKRLARTGVYDGLRFHRVVDGFMAQTGNPNNLDGGKSLEPDLPPEFTFRLGAETPRVQLVRPQGETAGFIGAQPYVAVDEIRMSTSPDRRVSAWSPFCAGVVAMGHDGGDDGGNSGFFIMRAATRSLDRSYSVVGRVILGLDIVRGLTPGDPPIEANRLLRAQVMADLPESARPQIRVLNTLSPEFRALADQVRAIKGADFSICDLEAPVQVVAAPPSPAKSKPKTRKAARPKPRPPADAEA